MGTGIYVKNLKGIEAGLGEVGAINNRAKMERAARRERQVSQREVHAKKNRNRKNKSYLYDDEYEYEY